MEIAVSSISSITRTAKTRLMRKPMAHPKICLIVVVAITFEVIVVEYKVLKFQNVVNRKKGTFCWILVPLKPFLGYCEGYVHRHGGEQRLPIEGDHDFFAGDGIVFHLLCENGTVLNGVGVFSQRRED